MQFSGVVHNGVIVLQNSPPLPEGTRVRIDVELPDSEGEALRQLLLQYAGQATGLPSDLAEQHDHYLHGTPKR